MVKDRDNKYEDQEESEYHFSDEDISYEVETESPKPSTKSEKGINIFSRFTQSRRLIIGAGVFVALVFVVYKMVVPGTSTPSTDITPPVVAAARESNVLPNAQVPVARATPQVPSANPAAPTTAPLIQTAQNVPPVAQPAMTSPQVTPPQQTAVQPAVIERQQQSTLPIVANMPAMIPVQSAMPPSNVNQPAAQVQTGAAPSQLANMATFNEKVVNQLQSEYSQKLAEYETQNKALQDQMQTLNTRVAMMETQMNQLVQALTRQNQGNNAAPAEQQAQPADSKVSYSVQAIIPGRAWLRSDNGEALTVAEGDVIKNLGRVTKIDPYDGVVEINTGNKVISLSYGSGG